MISTSQLIGIVSVLLSAPLLASPPSPFSSPPSGQILSTGAGKVMLMNQEGKILWQHKAGNAHDCWMLANGHILMADGQIREIDPVSGKTTFHYQPTITKGGGVYSCQALSNGRILIGENSSSKIYEMNRNGKVEFELQLPLHSPGSHHNLRMVRKLDNGNYLVCHSSKHLVREYSPEGKIVFAVKVDNIAFAAIRRPNGNTLISHIDAITEFSPDGKKVWQCHKLDLQPLTLGSFCGIHLLENGNLAVGIYAAYKKGGQAAMLEITRNKQVVWKYSKPSADKSIMSLQILNADGKPINGPTLR